MWVVDLAQSLVMGGYFVGSIVFGQLSDTWGRRPILVISKCKCYLGNRRNGVTNER